MDHPRVAPGAHLPGGDDDIGSAGYARVHARQGGTGDDAGLVEVNVPKEEPVTLMLNDEELATMLASPGSRRELAVGFLLDEGIVDRLDQISALEEIPTGIRVEAEGVEVGKRLFERRVFGSGCGKAVGFTSALDALAAAGRSLPEELPWTSGDTLLTAASTAYSRSGPYARTRGTHSAWLFDRRGNLVAVAEDIGRHNAVDKVIGGRLLQGESLDGIFMAVTGRISSEMVTKLARTPIPLLMSKSVPTDLALDYAQKLAMGVVGRAGSRRFTLYTFPELVELQE